MKKIVVVIMLALFAIGCNKKSSPAASNTGSSSSNEKAIVSNTGLNTAAPAASSSSSTAAAIDPASQGSKTDAKQAGKQSAEQLGQITYSAKCGKCHGLKVTTDYTVDRWITVMQVMAPKARLTDEEKENVLAYVKLNAKKG